MKKLIILCWATLLRCVAAQAQTPFITMDSININNINATVLVHGDMWWDPDSAHHYPSKCIFPNGSRKTIAFASAIWMSGYDAGGGLHVAAQTYRQDGNDYWPGPLDGGDSITYSTSSDWAKIWKVNRTEIDSFHTFPRHTLSNTPASILTWPGKGNTYAQGNGGAALTVTTDMAPFVDRNGNGIYEPLRGDYPDIKGDQALWWIFNDDGPTHTQSHGHPLGVEVHAMAYAFRRGTLIDDVVYYDYTIVNRSHNDYHNFRLAFWGDMDLGYPYDDYLGFDSTWRMGIVYNGTNDDGGSGGHPVNTYGPNPPQSAITMVVLPGDSGADYVPAGSFTYYNNDFSIIGNPRNDTMVDNYIHAGMARGIDLSVTPPTNYVFNGDPSVRTQWSECASNDNPNDRRFVLSSNDFNLNADGSAHIVLAHIVADSAGGCPSTSFEKIRIVADTAWHRYHALAVSEPRLISDIKLYPNPVHEKLYLDETGSFDIAVYNMLGQKQAVSIISSGSGRVINVSGLVSGMYYVVCNNENDQRVSKFIKE